jgi:calcineurin-like phosphoesterase family protein
MWYFTADLHFDHPYMAQDRGFPYVTKMDKHLIEMWNKTVKPNGVVVVLGDVFWTDHVDYNLKVWKELNGNKLIVKGNHDYWLKKAKLDCKRIYQRKIYNFYVVCCHYPMMSWNRKQHGAIHLHGHSHGAIDPLPNMLDVGVDNALTMLGEYRPFTFKEILYLTTGLK